MLPVRNIVHAEFFPHSKDLAFTRRCCCGLGIDPEDWDPDRRVDEFLPQTVAKVGVIVARSEVRKRRDENSGLLGTRLGCLFTHRFDSRASSLSRIRGKYPPFGNSIRSQSAEPSVS